MTPGDVEFVDAHFGPQSQNVAASLGVAFEFLQVVIQVIDGLPFSLARQVATVMPIQEMRFGIGDFGFVGVGGFLDHSAMSQIACFLFGILVKLSCDRHG